MREKKLWELRIDEEFKNLIPPLQDDELSMLEESIQLGGCESPLIVWNDTIVDGHNRYEICHRNQIPFAVQDKEFAGRDAAMLWMIRNQLGRRNLNSFVRSELALKYEPMLAAEAMKKMRSGKSDPGQNFAQGSEEGRTSHQLADIANVSHTTLKKVKKILADGDEATKAELRHGKKSVHKAYTDIVKKEHEDERKVCDRCGQEKNLSDFAMPSNRTEYSNLCKNCEKQIAEAVKQAAEVASKTVEPVETHPAQGIAMHDGAPIHVSHAMPDTPDHFAHLYGMISSSAQSFLMTVDSAMRWYTEGMVREGNSRQLFDLVKKTYESAVEKINNRIKEM